MILFIFITLAYAFIRGISFIYLFQIKEYRFDRLFSRIRENGFINTFYTSTFRRPAFSARNLLILTIHAGSICVLFLVALEHQLVYSLLIIMIPFAPLLAFIIISLAVVITEIPVKTWRHLLILQAVVKVRKSKAVFIGITGTYGKTSVKEYISYILSDKFEVAKTDKNMNTGVGIALAINKNLTEKTQFFVTEVGSYTKGETRQATWYIPFTYGVLTGLGNQHLDLYGSRDALIQEETSLLTHIQNSGKIYINQSVQDLSSIVSHVSAPYSTYGFHHSTIKAKILGRHLHSTKAHIFYRGYDFIIETQLPGDHSVLNLLPAIALAMDCGMKTRDIIRRVSEIQPIEGKLSVHTGRAKATIINDAANSNLEGFIAALSVLGTYPQKTKYIISQGIIELGVEKRDSYQRIIEKLYTINAKLYTTDPLFKELDPRNEVMIFNDVVQMRDKIVSVMNKHTIILLEGKLSNDIKKSIMTL